MTGAGQKRSNRSGCHLRGDGLCQSLPSSVKQKGGDSVTGRWCKRESAGVCSRFVLKKGQRILKPEEEKARRKGCETQRGLTWGSCLMLPQFSACCWLSTSRRSSRMPSTAPASPTILPTPSNRLWGGNTAAGCGSSSAPAAFTFVFHFKVGREEVVLSVPQHEGQEGEDERVEDANDAEDVGPAHGAGAQRVLVRLVPTHALHLARVPAIRVDEAANHQPGRCGDREVLQPPATSSASKTLRAA